MNKTQLADPDVAAPSGDAGPAASALNPSAAAQLALADAGHAPDSKVTPPDDDQTRELHAKHYVRAKLFDGEKSNLRRYIDLVLGKEASVWSLIRYELTTGLLGGMPGAAGLQLRKWFYPRLFKSCGRGVIFGRHLTIRHGKKITLADNVVVDDSCELDGHGAGKQGVVIGEGAIINRDVSIKAKIGPIHIGRETDIGMRTIVHSQGGVFIGDQVVVGGYGMISGGIFQIDRTTPPNVSNEETGDREQERSTRGPIRIEDKCFIGMRCSFLDGVVVGEGSVIGAGSLVNKPVAPYSVAAGSPARVIRERPNHEDLAVV